MTVRGHIVDQGTGTGLPGASVLVTDGSGNPTGVGTAADGGGSFEINSAKLDQPGNVLMISSAGYTPVLVDPGFFSSNYTLQLERGGDLPEVVVTPGKRKDMTLILAAGCLAAAKFAGPAGRRVGNAPTASQHTDYSKYVVPAALVVGGGAILYGILGKLGIVSTRAEREVDAKRKEAFEREKSAVLLTQDPTKSTAEWAMIADAIYEDLRYSSVSDNKEDAGYQLTRVKNDADVYTLIDLFGTRLERFFGVPLAERTLWGFVTSNLSREKIDAINDNYSRKGIKYRW